jgi:hypothetical protein
MQELTKSQADQISSSQRIRDNQRRSRARRKEYVQDLEKRLRQFEVMGVQATREVQDAGRRVVEENAHLRSLLKLHGVSDLHIQDYLAKAKTGLPPFHSRTTLKAQPQRRQSPSLNVVNKSSSKLNSFNTQREEPLHEVTVIEATSRSSPAVIQSVTAPESQISERAPRDDFVDTSTNGPTELQPHHENQTPGQYTLCEIAAGIIASMRHDFDTRDVRVQLGCQSNSSCMVKNMDIFQLLDD